MRNNILYHGSLGEVKEPLANVGRRELDFGLGFYLTNDRVQVGPRLWQDVRKIRKPFLMNIVLMWKNSKNTATMNSFSMNTILNGLTLLLLAGKDKNHGRSSIGLKEA